MEKSPRIFNATQEDINLVREACEVHKIRISDSEGLREVWNSYPHVIQNGSPENFSICRTSDFMSERYYDVSCSDFIKIITGVVVDDLLSELDTLL